MEININDARRSSLCVNLADRYRWALLKLDLCSITAILRPRVLLIPARSKPTRDARDDFIYTRRKPAASPRRRGATRKKKERTKENEKETKAEKTRILSRTDASQNAVQFVSHFISDRRAAVYPIRIVSHAGSLSVRRVCTPARFIPVERR